MRTQRGVDVRVRVCPYAEWQAVRTFARWDVSLVPIASGGTKVGETVGRSERCRIVLVVVVEEEIFVEDVCYIVAYWWEIDEHRR